MRGSRICLTAAFAMACLALNAAPVTWSREELFAVPKSWSAEDVVTGALPDGVKASFLEGLPFKGRATRVFAYWGVPAAASAEKPVPAMVLVHGGGGSAFANWVKFWNDRGYAAISMDLNGRVSGDLAGKNTKHERHAWGGPGEGGCGGFDLLKERPEDQWMYHAVAAVVKSHSFLRAQPGVDPKRIGMTGVSWGGVVNCVVASVDDRLKFAIPVYGCGFLYEPCSSWTHRYGGPEAKITRQRKDGWSPLWDPMNYLPEAKIPIHWLNGTNDGNFSLPSLQRSRDLVPTESSLSLRVRMDHCHGKVSEQAIEVVSIADAAFRGAPALPKLERPVLGDGRLSARYGQDDRLPVRSASLDFTADDCFWWYSNRWDSVSAQVSGGCVSAAVPSGATWAYLSVRTTNDIVISSSIVDLRKKGLGYLDLAEIAVKAYDDARMEEYVREAETVGVQEHGFPRLASNLGRLVAAGRMAEKKPMLERMLTVACACAKKGKMPPKSGGNEFSVRELVSAVVALEKAGAFPSERIAAWKADLAAVDANRCYKSPEWFRLADSVGHNWPLFGAASEQARIHYGLGGDPKFIEDWVSDQLRHFDRNGLYRDPHEPSVYDFIGRLCFMQILHFGYDGPCRAKIEEELLASAEPTLAMLSVSGEIPFGGRSNQFLHNNTMYAAVAEWYAAFFAKRGDAETAVRFRSAAARAVAALEPWVKDGQVFHVKNRFPKPETEGARNVDQKWFGCEGYAYFDKYMVTMGSWAMLADEFSRAQPLPESGDCPSLDFSTSEHFHWRFVQSRNYTVQEDWNANTHYDATGIGRIHRRGAPPAICLSTPFAESPSYGIGAAKNPGPLAIAATGGKMSYEVDDWGVRIKVQGDGTLTLPAFEFDGEETTRIVFDAKLVKVFYRGWVCRYATRGGTFADTGLRYFNRNGRSRRIDCTGKDFEVFVTIERENRGSCICGVASERQNDFYWENDRVGFRAYGPGEYHKWSGIDLFIKKTSSNAVERLLREPGCHGNWHKDENPYAYDDFAVGPGHGCGGVAVFADGGWKTYPDWETARVIHEGDDYLEFELVYPACCALGKMTYHITMRKGDDFFRNDVSFERPGAMGKDWIVRPEIKEDPNCRAKPFLRFTGDGTKPCFSYEAGFTVQK